MLTARTCLTHVCLLPSCSQLHASLPINLPSWDTPQRTADDILSTVVDPSNFLPLWHKAPKREEKKKDQHLLIISLDVSPINIITSCSSPGTTITIIVVGVNTCMALTVTGGGVTSGTSGTPRLLSLMVSLQGLIPICCSSLLLLLII